MWQQSSHQTLPVEDALHVCRQCCDLLPFVFNNRNTFAAISKRFVEDLAKNLPAVEAQIVRNTVGHYVAGVIERSELLGVLRHFEKQWKPAQSEDRVDAPLPVAQPQPTTT